MNDSGTESFGPNHRKDSSISAGAERRAFILTLREAGRRNDVRGLQTSEILNHRVENQTRIEGPELQRVLALGEARRFARHDGRGPQYVRAPRLAVFRRGDVEGLL